MGREATSTYKEPNAGYMGIATCPSVGNFMFPDSGGNAYILTVDPWIMPGNPASGPIKGVSDPPALAVGAADPTGTQAYNFRVIMTQNPARMVAAAGHPAGRLRRERVRAVPALPRCHHRQRPELPGRAAGDIASTTNKLFCIQDLLTFNGLTEGYDINARGGISSDYIGSRPPT